MTLGGGGVRTNWHSLRQFEALQAVSATTAIARRPPSVAVRAFMRQVRLTTAKNRLGEPL